MSDFGLFCSEMDPNHKPNSYEAGGLSLWFVCAYFLLGQRSIPWMCFLATASIRDCSPHHNKDSLFANHYYQNDCIPSPLPWLYNHHTIPIILTWLVVWTPLYNMKVSWDDELPNIWKNQSHVPVTHQPVIFQWKLPITIQSLSSIVGSYTIPILLSTYYT